MAYSNKVLDHYNNPRNVGSMDKSDPNVGTGMVGAPECGDVMKLQVKVNPDTGVIEDAKFKTFGCGSAIASSSLATEWLRGKTLTDASSVAFPYAFPKPGQYRLWVQVKVKGDVLTGVYDVEVRLPRQS